jgi:hypothetical protein
MSDAIKVTIKARREWVGKAQHIATRYLDEWIARDGADGIKRPKQRDCMIVAVGDHDAVFAVWGDAAHVRVYEGNL